MNPIEWENNRIKIIDQTQLPHKLKFLYLDSIEKVKDAICKMKVRGAPALGVAAAFGVVVGVQDSTSRDFNQFKREVEGVCRFLRSSRPTAVNLSWALDRMYRVVVNNAEFSLDKIKQKLAEEALCIMEEDRQCNRAIGEKGASLINDGDTVLTHCNAGVLATAGYGTALSIIYQAKNEGKKVKVYVDETRPLLQGSRLTCWELLREAIEVTLICDSVAGELMREGKINKVVVGADRVVANGDAANKIGTYSLSVLAKENKVAFYVACPLSTIDLSIASGDEIPIEIRSDEEVTTFCGRRCAPEGVDVYNPAFDITPSRYISAIITERGICRAPYEESLRIIFGG
ncbi:S-methyl-5-thioribose-1-phosphate isomerase [Candidatus Aerophobetes bacterium]|nr:S-methyl-5-thioribose-1-phosphate isomerase [Candidatus Aerophobetes bacterium]